MNIAALLLPIALMQASAEPLSGSGQARFQACIDLIDVDANRAYEEGMAWASLTQELGGYRCAAMALIAQGRNEEGARRLESLSISISSEDPVLRTELLSQAGNAWLLARDAGHARSAFTRAIATMAPWPDQLPDLLIDRARAYALEENWRASEEDLSRALDLRARDPLALRLRSYARMQQSSFELAEADAQAAVALEPSNVDSLLMLGHAREARRTGQPVDY